MILLALASIFFIMDYKYHAFVKFKNFFLLPRHYIIQTVNFPFELFKDFNNYLSLHKNLVRKNISLKQLINTQAAKLQVLQSLELENIRLRELLKFSEDHKNTFSLANVIEVAPDLFKHQVVLDRGSLHGAYVGQPVLSAEGVVGSLVVVEKSTSIAILITDLSYAIPVLNSRNGVRAIALGFGDLQTLTLQHVPKTADIKSEDIFVTSGMGGRYPPGYTVGKVSQIKREVNFPFASVQLEVAANLASCKELLLLHSDKK